MQNGSGISVGNEVDRDCAFCQHNGIAYILKETPHFLLAADHAPLVEGHLLIISKRHYACFGEAPVELDAELIALKQEVRRFFTRFYAPPVFWEHGVFRQTVFHAHLHCFPWSTTGYDFSEGLHNQVVTSQEDLRTWYASRGHYFYMEDASGALLFAPEMDRYLGIIKSVFWRGIASRGGHPEFRPPQQRFEEGVPLIRAMTEKWQTFQRQGVDYASGPNTR